jgi:hypothetical protein
MPPSPAVSTIKLQKQKFKNDSRKGTRGDCWRTCVAMICGVDRDSVPHDHNIETPDEWRAWREDTAAMLGVKFVEAPYALGPDFELEEIIAMGLHRGFGLPFILSGSSKIRVGHSVVIDETGVMHDPSGNGIIGPCDDDLYWLEWVVRPYR